MATMVREPASPVKDDHYDLLHTLQMSLEHVWKMENYIADADARGDKELATWFRGIQDDHRKMGEQGKKLLKARLQQEKV
ncbi:hypothetical protein AB0M35_10880 [Micromonospora sp. NPDC051196]|uniref:hypothetical protein n=1 Tax=Micromonospora sp. NPDC051196 TaxID=3155281 RepID=UPI0034168A3F